MLFVSEFSCGSLRILRSGKEYNAHITHKGESIMRDRIISNVLIKMGNRIKKKELDYLENVLVEEFRDVQIKKESTELTEYNDSLRKLKDTFLATLIVENKSNRTIEQYNLHLTQFVDYFTGKEAKDIDATDIRGFLYAYKQSRGMPLQDVAILLGHADINMTAGTYYDASDDMIEYEYIRYAA